jgi:hypothetical protein
LFTNYYNDKKGNKKYHNIDKLESFISYLIFTFACTINIKWFDYFYIVKTSCSIYIVVFNDYVFAISPFLILEQVLNVSKVQT